MDKRTAAIQSIANYEKDKSKNKPIDRIRSQIRTVKYSPKPG
jgi:hypothetical protein